MAGSGEEEEAFAPPLRHPPSLVRQPHILASQHRSRVAGSTRPAYLSTSDHHPAVFALPPMRGGGLPLRSLPAATQKTAAAASAHRQTSAHVEMPFATIVAPLPPCGMWRSEPGQDATAR